MQIEALEIRNYRLFRDTKLTDLPRLTIVVGTNGSGKSTLFDVFSFLKEALTQNVASAVSRRGGSANSSAEEKVDRFPLQSSFAKVAVVSPRTSSRSQRMRAVRSSIGRCSSSRAARKASPGTSLTSRAGRGAAITNEAAYGQEGVEADRKEYVLDDPSVLAIKGLGQFKEFRVVAEFRSLIENWHISDFHISDARPSSEAGYAEHLSTRGDNIAQVAQYLYENHRDRFDRVLQVMSERVPGVNRVEAKPTVDGRLVLPFRTIVSGILSSRADVSDGTIKMFAYLVLLYDPKPHPLLAVEEPENQLYPELLLELVEEFRDYARRGGQVFVSTHSPDFLNGARLEEIYWLVKDRGFTTARRASESETLQNLVAEGDLPGALWKQGLFEGVGPR